MRSTTPDGERVAFLNGGIASPPPFSLDDDPDPDIIGTIESTDAHDARHGLLSKADIRPYRPASRWRVCCGGRLRLSRRGPKRRLLGLVLKYLFGTVFALLVLTPLLAPSYLHPPAHYTRLVAQCEAQFSGPEEGLDRIHGCANPHREKVFISVSLYDKEGHLAAGAWGQALVELVRLLGPRNTYVSIYGNGSGRHGASALEHLRRLLPCRNTVVYDEHVPLDRFANITMPDGNVRTKRLAYLSEMRNRALRPLDTLGGVEGIVFDKVLFLNDVAFRPIDAAQLLFSTNQDAEGHAQYLSACALDYKNPLLFYDLYAQRDAEGFSNGLPLFPIFSRAGKGLSRADMLAQTDAVRVQSCWGGMVAMQAAYLQHRNDSLPRPDFHKPGSHVIDPIHPTGIVAPVRFRYEPEIFFDACECCLLHADVSQAARVATEPAFQSLSKGVFVNPYVRVAYDWTTLDRLRIVQRWERLFALPQAIISYFASLPTHNPHRLVKEGDAFIEEVWSNTANAWTLESRTGRNGMFCGVREMQLLDTAPRQGDKNWANVHIPTGQALDFPS
ncbi:hypothetical protein SPBR_01589 [Sporothrix brasiliensis 5110]|uniref:Glycosyltransferase family 69 protein n=1 Tax=Sporothrix brasiliensis 5110 TaxID=1398154 RepID=A0A0C2J2M9_9PEZI|nr:uncharacterized protein SPBR_01589 [Sporothrix brasiliensis 5110]KIH91342.1 hypothetical protein SPBR_01589 [Sporothrix brasiliensis 5110]